MGTSTVPPPSDERTVRLARRRFARRQWARRWLAWRRLLVLLLVVAVLAGTVWLLLFSSVLAVAGATVTGAPAGDATLVRRAADVPVGNALATADLAAVATRVERLPFVRSADVSRAWPDRIRIDVHERVPVAVVPRAGGFSALDEHGMLFHHAARRPAGLPVVHSGSRTRRDALAEAAKVAAALPAAVARRVGFVDVHTVDSITLHLHDGRDILWGSAEQSGDKARVIGALLQHRAAYYDVSVPGQPVIRR